MDMNDNVLASLLIEAALVRSENAVEKEYSPSDRFKITLNKNLRANGLDPFYSFFFIKRRRAAAIVAAVVAALVLTRSVGAIREKVVNFFVDIFDSFAVITTDKSAEYPNKIEERYAPSYIPEGYAFDKTDRDMFISESIWKNKTGGKIIFEQMVQGTNTFFNTEKRFKYINIYGENDGVLWESESMRSIYFEYNEYFFKIISNPELSEEELIKIAKSLETTKFTKS